MTQSSAIPRSSLLVPPVPSGWSDHELFPVPVYVRATADLPAGGDGGHPGVRLRGPGAG